MSDCKELADVSVVIPCYKCKNTLARAVYSVANQSLRPKEIILVDDFSQDGTLDFIFDLRESFEDNFIKVIALNRNSGPAAARNAGWELASSEYIAFLDSDDAWHPDKIFVQYSWMTNNKHVVLSGHPCATLDCMPSVSSDLNNKNYYAGEFVGGFDIVLSNKFQTPSVMIKRNFPMRMDENMRYCEDYLLWLRIILNKNIAYQFKFPFSFLFKNPYGDGGLSGNLFKMQVGEIDAFRKVKNEGLINFVEFLLVSAYSLSKFVRRLIIVTSRRIFK